MIHQLETQKVFLWDTLKYKTLKDTHIMYILVFLQETHKEILFVLSKNPQKDILKVYL